MTMRLAGVATGVRNDAAPATVSAIMNGSTLRSRACATETATGATMSTVAMFETNWPSTTVTRHSTSRAASGPAPPSQPSSHPARASAAPVVANAVDIAIMPAISSTVVHEIAR
jgi:hypothetical protein